MHPLRVVVLVPEQRQDDHRLPEVQRLGGRVVAPVSDDEVHLGDHLGLRQDRGPDHVVGEVDHVSHRSLAHDVPVLRAPEHVNKPSHQVYVRSAQRPEGQIDQCAAGRSIGDGLRHLIVLVGLANAGIDAMPRVTERPDPPIVRLSRIDIEVRVLGLVHELQVGQVRCSLSDHPLVEGVPDRAMGPVVLRPEGRPTAVVVLRETGERGGDASVRHLEWVAGDDAYERRVAGDQGREAHHVVLDHHVRAHLCEDLTQPGLAEL